MPSIVIEDLEIREELIPAEMEAVFGGKKKKKKKKKDKYGYGYDYDAHYEAQFGDVEEDPFVAAMRNGESKGMGDYFFFI